MRAREFITEHRMVWKRTSNGVKLRWRCESGPRTGRTVPAVNDCSAAPDIAQAQRMKKTRSRTKIRQSRRTKRTKRINPTSKLVQKLNQAVNKIIKKSR
jgi:hypothetical protein